MKIKIKRGILLVILFLLVINFVYSTDYYVSTIGSDSTGNGSSGNSWATIQYAINNVSTGDIIYVVNGTYIENVDVNKSVSLIGNGYQNTTIISLNPADHVFEVTSNNTNINGFSIDGNSTNRTYGIYLNGYPFGLSNSNISKNLFRNSQINIYANRPLNSFLLNNNIISNLNYGGKGIYITYGRNTSIYKNNVSLTEIGIHISNSNNTILINNTIQNSSRKGLFIYMPYNLTLHDNNFSGSTHNFAISSTGNENIQAYMHNISSTNKVNGKPMYYWTNVESLIIPEDAGFVAVINSTNITVENLSLSNLEKGIIFAYTQSSKIKNINITEAYNNIFLINSDSNIIENNNLSLSLDSLIYLSSSNENIIRYNNLTNSIKGIYLTGSSDNEIYQNFFKYNTEYALKFYSSSTDNLIADNIFKKNKAGIVSSSLLNENEISGNQVLDSSEVTIFDINFNNKIIELGDSLTFNISINHINGSSISNFYDYYQTYNISINPSLPSKSISLDGNIISGNLTPTERGTHSLIVNILDSEDNEFNRKYSFFVGPINYETKTSYLRPNLEANHGQPRYTDSAPITSNIPNNPSNFTCGDWIQASFDEIPKYIPIYLENVSISIWQKITGDTSLMGIQRYISYDQSIDTSINIPEEYSDYTWLEINFTNLNWTMDYLTDWYWLTLKESGADPSWYTNTSQPSYVNFTYAYTNTPEIVNLTNTNNIQILSATSPPANLNNATITLDGEGNTELTIQMINQVNNYLAKYDETECNQSNCNFTQNNGLLNFDLVLGSEHNLTIYTIPEETTTSSSWTDRITTSNDMEVEKLWRVIHPDQSYEWIFSNFQVIDRLTFTSEERSSNARINIKLLDGKPAGTETLENIYQYLNITTRNLNIKQANITFKVNRTFADQKGKTVLSRHTNKWQDLETKYLGKDDDYKYYRAVTPGFSSFVIRKDIQKQDLEENIPRPTLKEKIKEVYKSSNLYLIPISIILIIGLIIIIKKKKRKKFY
jgi:PGF-pre-PGF domain-containing protein